MIQKNIHIILFFLYIIGFVTILALGYEVVEENIETNLNKLKDDLINSEEELNGIIEVELFKEAKVFSTLETLPSLFLEGIEDQLTKKTVEDTILDTGVAILNVEILLSSGEFFYAYKPSMLERLFIDTEQLFSELEVGDIEVFYYQSENSKIIKRVIKKIEFYIEGNREEVLFIIDYSTAEMINALKNTLGGSSTDFFFFIEGEERLFIGLDRFTYSEKGGRTIQEVVDFLDFKIIEESDSEFFYLNENKNFMGYFFSVESALVQDDQTSFLLVSEHSLLENRPLLSIKQVNWVNRVLHATTINRLIIFNIIMITLFVLANIYRKERKEHMFFQEYSMLINNLMGVIEDSVDMNDAVTGQHTKRVGAYSYILARSLYLPIAQSQQIKLYAPVHDIGKIAISDNILNKPGKLTADEYTKMKTHVSTGYDFIKAMKTMNSVAKNIVLFHHERWDGEGYLEGLKGEEIPIEGRIISLADVYDALRMERPYKEPFTHERTKDIILKEREKMFDPKLIDIFLENEVFFSDIFSKDSDEIVEKWEKQNGFKFSSRKKFFRKR